MVIHLARESVYYHINWTEVPFSIEQLSDSMGSFRTRTKEAQCFEILYINLSLAYPFYIMKNLLKKQNPIF